MPRLFADWPICRFPLFRKTRRTGLCRPIFRKNHKSPPRTKTLSKKLRKPTEKYFRRLSLRNRNHPRGFFNFYACSRLRLAVRRLCGRTPFRGAKPASRIYDPIFPPRFTYSFGSCSAVPSSVFCSSPERTAPASPLKKASAPQIAYTTTFATFTSFDIIS